MQEVIYIFIAIFLAEVGDKTQLATMAFATRYGWIKAFTGSILALALVNLIGAVIGDRIGDALPLEIIHKAGGLLFIVFGVLMILGKL